MGFDERTRRDKREEKRREVEDYDSTNVIHAGAQQRCKSIFFLLSLSLSSASVPPPVLSSSFSTPSPTADSALCRGARLRLCYEIDLKAKCSFSPFLSLARAFLFTFQAVASTLASYRSA